MNSAGGEGRGGGAGHGLLGGFGGKGGWGAKNFFPHPIELLIWACPDKRRETLLDRNHFHRVAAFGIN